jgi:hypothetical protein
MANDKEPAAAGQMEDCSSLAIPHLNCSYAGRQDGLAGNEA